VILALMRTSKTVAVSCSGYTHRDFRVQRVSFAFASLFFLFFFFFGWTTDQQPSLLLPFDFTCQTVELVRPLDRHVWVAAELRCNGKGETEFKAASHRSEAALRATQMQALLRDVCKTVYANKSISSVRVASYADRFRPLEGINKNNFSKMITRELQGAAATEEVAVRDESPLTFVPNAARAL
jgi:hypothetical protein